MGVLFGNGHDQHYTGSWKKIGFVYADRITQYLFTKSRDDAIKMHDDNLDWMQNYQTEGRHTHYQDETWIFKNVARWKAWKNTTGNTTDGCFTVPSGKGEQSILSHIGSPETGLLEQSMFSGLEVKQVIWLPFWD